MHDIVHRVSCIVYMDFEQIEDQIVATLKTNITYARTVETYAGQLEADIAQLPVRYPAIYVVYAGSQFAWVDGPNHNEACEFSIFVVATNLRGQENIRKDSHGCYQLILDVLTALTNKTFGLDIYPIKPLRAELLYTDKTMSAYTIVFETNFDKTYS